MAVFYVLIFVPLIIQHVAIKDLYIDYAKRNRIALAFFFSFLTFLIACRHMYTGNDTANYIYYFEKAVSSSWSATISSDLEIGYAIYMKLFTLVTHDVRVYLAISAVIVSAMIFPTYRRLCEDASLIIVLFCSLSTFIVMFSGIRQMMAVGLGILAYEMTRNKKLIFFVAFVLLAMSFHTSAIILVFMYPLYYVRITAKWLFAVVPVMVLVFIFNKPILSFLSAYVDRYTSYDSFNTETGAYSMIILFVLFAVFSFVIPDEDEMDKETIGLRNYLLLSVTLQFFAPINLLAMRLNYFYIIFIPLLLPKIIAFTKNRYWKFAMLGRHILVVFFLLYFFFSAYRNTNSNLHVFPYYFFWEYHIL